GLSRPTVAPEWLRRTSRTYAAGLMKSIARLSVYRVHLKWLRSISVLPCLYLFIREWLPGQPDRFQSSGRQSVHRLKSECFFRQNPHGSATHDGLGQSTLPVGSVMAFPGP